MRVFNGISNLFDMESLIFESSRATHNESLLIDVVTGEIIRK
jgi:hypothetical protein